MRLKKCMIFVVFFKVCNFRCYIRGEEKDQIMNNFEVDINNYEFLRF